MRASTHTRTHTHRHAHTQAYTQLILAHAHRASFTVLKRLWLIIVSPSFSSLLVTMCAFYSAHYQLATMCVFYSIHPVSYHCIITVFIFELQALNDLMMCILFYNEHQEYEHKEKKYYRVISLDCT